MKIHKPIFLFALFCAAASGATLFMGAYPDSVIVFDEGKGQVVDKINLTTGLPISMRPCAIFTVSGLTWPPPTRIS